MSKIFLKIALLMALVAGVSMFITPLSFGESGVRKEGSERYAEHNHSLEGCGRY
jgi:hypothetical protein